MEKYLIQDFYPGLLSKIRETPDEIEAGLQQNGWPKGSILKKTTPHGEPFPRVDRLWVSPKKKGSSSNNPAIKSESI
jgi:hypothetical protein